MTKSNGYALESIANRMGLNPKRFKEWGASQNFSQLADAAYGNDQELRSKITTAFLNSLGA